jgi:hypothetical protein
MCAHAMEESDRDTTLVRQIQMVMMIRKQAHTRSHLAS